MDTITADTAVSCGIIKPVHGVCNSPVSFGGLTDLSRAWKKAGFPYGRLHDNDWPHPVSVDIPQIFRNFSADAGDPANYDFTNTDASLKAILECGAQIIYRLGTSIEHTVRKVYTDVPDDYEKWADICVHIIRHYNEGWADGFHWNIQFWEIWNEPDLNQDDMWKGSPEQYFDLYVTAAKKIKSACPDVKVGGPALAGYGHSDFALGMLKKIREENAPLDFFSWHLYRNEPKHFRDALSTVEGYLNELDFKNVTLICDEWDFNPVYGFALSNEDEVSEKQKVAYFSTMTDEIGAAFCASVLCTFQNSINDIATYYDSQPANLWCGIFDRYGVPTKSYYAFCAFNELYKLGNAVQMNGPLDGLYYVSAKDNNKLCILVSRYLSVSDNVEIILNNLPYENAVYSIRRTDKMYTDTEAEKGTVNDNRIEFFLPENGIALITVTKDETD